MPGALKPNPPGEAKPEGLSKYIKRMRTVLRRGSVSTKSESAPTMEGKAGEQAGNTTSRPAMAPTPAPAQQNPAPTPDQPILIPHWPTVQEARTRALFAKYGLSLSHDDYKPSDSAVQRVAKPIRMRVRRSCHRCQTPFGPARVCTNCQHTRCKSCPRHPPKQQGQEMDWRGVLARKGGVGTQRQGQEMPEQKQKQQQKQKPLHRSPNEYLLTIPSRTGGQDLVRKPVMQRVRRTCHRCQRVFTAGSKQCTGCEHVRCKKCPRDPPKLEKYPDGYPGDVDPPPEAPPRTWRKPRRRVRYTCHVCSTLYKAGQEVCVNCGQERCEETRRDPPKRDKPDPDPEIVRKVEERLASLRIKE